MALSGQANGSRSTVDNPAIALLTVLGSSPPSKVVINELTTVASAFTSARFLNGDALSGNPLGLRIAAGNAPNLVEPATGGWGKVLLDPLNSSMTTTLAKFDTLGSLITYATVANKVEAAAGSNPAGPTSTWGGGSGFTVIYGVAAPVKPPSRIGGKVQRY
jgi:hypothetical protein